MKILLFGQEGQVGSVLADLLPALGSVIPAAIDITDCDALNLCLNHVQPDVIVNAAAYTFVDRAENEQDLCYKTNVVAISHMAQYAKENNALLIHYSTDYVFSGAGDLPWRETDIKSPLNIYGKTKAQSDDAIALSGCRHLIFRTSWIYGTNGQNFVKTILRLAQERQEIEVVQDQIGSPTSAKFLGQVTLQALSREDIPYGIYHVRCDGITSWFEYAKFLLTESGMDKECYIQPILSANYKQDARRPLNSRLNIQKFQDIFGIVPPHWQDEIRRDLPEIIRTLSC